MMACSRVQQLPSECVFINVRYEKSLYHMINPAALSLHALSDSSLVCEAATRFIRQLLALLGSYSLYQTVSYFIRYLIALYYLFMLSILVF